MAWNRKANSYLVKSKKMTDGEMLHLLVRSSDHDNLNDLDEKIYRSLQDVRGEAHKALFWVLGSSAFGVLSHFQVLRGLSNSGLDLSPTIFNHAALLALSFSTAAYCFLFSKQTFLQTWFSWKFKSGSPRDHALLLVKYPDAFWHFYYLRSAIGYPANILYSRSIWPQVIYLILVIIALVAFAGGSIALWCALVMDVWLAPNVSEAISIATIALAVTVTLLGWMSPFYIDGARHYDHHGLVNLLQKRTGARLSRAHQRIILVAHRMGLETRLD